MRNSLHQHRKYELKRICMMEKLSFWKLVPVIIFRALSKDLLWTHSVLLEMCKCENKEETKILMQLHFQPII